MHLQKKKIIEHFLIVIYLDKFDKISEFTIQDVYLDNFLSCISII